jgi:hypothetical protein
VCGIGWKVATFSGKQCSGFAQFASSSLLISRSVSQ